MGAGLIIVCIVWTGKDTGRKWYLSNDLRQGGGHCRCLGERHQRQIRDQSTGLEPGVSLEGPCRRNGEQGGGGIRQEWGGFGS